MTKFSGIAPNATPALGDYVVGVTSGNVDYRATLQSLINAVGQYLPTNAITLGCTQVTSNQTTTSLSFVDIPGLSSTVTVPTGGRRALIMVEGDRWACSTTGVGIYAQILDGSTVIGTFTLTAHNTGNGALPLSFFATNVPAAGSHTYKVQFKTDGGTITITAGATSPLSLLVLLI